LGFLCHWLFCGRYGGWRWLDRFALGLEFAEFGSALVEQSVSLRAGAVHGFLDSDSIFVGSFHGVEDVLLAVVETQDEVGFDFAAAAETPCGAVDFFHEDVFEETARSELLNEPGLKGGVPVSVDC
jgi:hypothetical protein